MRRECAPRAVDQRIDDARIPAAGDNGEPRLRIGAWIAGEVLADQLTVAAAAPEGAAAVSIDELEVQVRLERC